MKYILFFIWLHSCTVFFCLAGIYYVKVGEPVTCEVELNASYNGDITWDLITVNGTIKNIATCGIRSDCRVHYDQTNYQASRRFSKRLYQPFSTVYTLKVEKLSKDIIKLNCLYGLDQRLEIENCFCSFVFGVPPTYSSDKSYFDRSDIPFIVVPSIGGLLFILIFCTACCSSICKRRKVKTRTAHTRTMRNRGTNTIFTVEQSPNLHHTETQTESILSQSTTSFSTLPLISNIPLRHTTSYRNDSNLNERGQQNNLRMSDDYPPSYSSLFRSV
ncbi:uncharacterized protein LOC131934851 [Physella acuta]|uniref:uncharacterized protein LOC131934851 n=1 Tax=Physella acuta TaxID=109671 RepID=UPI0027DC4775|nr:uncharacterized protein LOC131934851 [Physella acuta]